MLNGLIIAIAVLALQSAGQLVPISDIEKTSTPVAAPTSPPPAASPAERPSGMLAALTSPSPTGGFWVRVAAEELFVRSRADLNSEPLTTVTMDMVLRAVDRQPGFFRVEPPSDCFSYIKASYVKRLSATQGVTTGDNVNVRVGNAKRGLDPLKQERQLSLPLGAKVDIVGEDLNGEWIKIRPPAGVYGYVASDYVEQISDQQAASLGAKLPPERRIELQSGTVVDRLSSSETPPRADSDGDLGTFSPAGSETGDGALPALASTGGTTSSPTKPDEVAGTELVPFSNLVAGRVGGGSTGTPSSQPSGAAITSSTEITSSATPLTTSGDPQTRLEWIYKLSEAERYIQEEAQRPPAAAVWEVGIQKLDPIARQTSESDLANIAQLKIQQLKQRISNQEFLRKAEAATTGPGSYSVIRTQESYRANFRAGSSSFLGAGTSPPGTNYDARGILKIKPDRSTADQVGRPRLIDPFTNAIIAYLDIGEMKIDRMEHRWVGVRGTLGDEPGGIKTVQVRDIQALTNTDIGVQRPR